DSTQRSALYPFSLPPPPATERYPPSLHDALPISAAARLLLDRTVRRQVHSAADGDDDRGHRQRRKDDEAPARRPGAQREHPRTDLRDPPRGALPSRLR